MEADDLKHIVSWQMPFGRFRGRCLAELPEEYLLWFARRGYPSGRLGYLMELTLEIKANGQEDILRALRQHLDTPGP